MSEQITDACEILWSRITAQIASTYSTDQDRQSDGNYVKGYRNDIEQRKAEIAGHIVVAKEIRWQTFNLAADRDGVRRVLEVHSGDGRVLLRAVQEGPIKEVLFHGPAEEYSGSNQIPAKGWELSKG